MVLGAYCDMEVGRPNNVSGSPTRTDSRQIYWLLASLILVITFTTSWWNIHLAAFQYCCLSLNLALIRPSIVGAVAVLSAASSRPVEMPSLEATKTPSG